MVGNPTMVAREASTSEAMARVLEKGRARQAEVRGMKEERPGGGSGPPRLWMRPNLTISFFCAEGLRKERESPAASLVMPAHARKLSESVFLALKKGERGAVRHGTCLFSWVSTSPSPIPSPFALTARQSPRRRRRRQPRAHGGCAHDGR